MNTVKDLRAKAKDSGLRGYSTMNPEQLNGAKAVFRKIEQYLVKYAVVVKF